MRFLYNWSILNIETYKGGDGAASAMPATEGMNADQMQTMQVWLDTT